MTAEQTPQQEGKPTRSSWRDRVKVHPACAAFPMMSDAELEEFGRDIEENGQKTKIVLWTPAKPGSLPKRGKNSRPKEVYLLDGQNRLEAAERMDNARTPGDEYSLVDDMLYESAGHETWGAVLLWGDVDPWKHVISLNAHRRHLTQEEKRYHVLSVHRRNPQLSARALAKETGVSDKTAGAVMREEAAANAESSALDRVEASGRKARGRKPQPKPKSRSNTAETAQAAVMRAPEQPAELQTVEQEVDALRALWGRSGPAARRIFRSEINAADAAKHLNVALQQIAHIGKARSVGI
jgi:hypothetical protein